MQDVTLRMATADDAGVLARLCQEHAAFEQLPYLAAGHAQRLAQALAAGVVFAWLLEERAVALGYAAVTLDYSTLSGRSFAHLDCLYLASTARSQGLGRRLLAAVGQFALARGCTELQWQTPQWNEGAIRFYDRCGARRLPKQRFSLALPC